VQFGEIIRWLGGVHSFVVSRVDYFLENGQGKTINRMASGNAKVRTLIGRTEKFPLAWPGGLSLTCPLEMETVAG
jgi:hypothetical protein